MNKAWNSFDQKGAPTKPVLRRLKNAAVPDISREVIAVITAAVVAAMGQNASEYRIASIRKHDLESAPPSIWSQAGRLERINARLKFFERRGR